MSFQKDNCRVPPERLGSGKACIVTESMFRAGGPDTLQTKNPVQGTDQRNWLNAIQCKMNLCLWEELHWRSNSITAWKEIYQNQMDFWNKRGCYWKLRKAKKIECGCQWIHAKEKGVEYTEIFWNVSIPVEHYPFLYGFHISKVLETSSVGHWNGIAKCNVERWNSCIPLTRLYTTGIWRPCLSFAQLSPWGLKKTQDSSGTCSSNIC